MKKFITSTVLIVAVIWIVGLIFRQYPGRRNWVYMPDMYDSPAYSTQSVNPVFTGGKTQKKPVAGTIPRGHLPLHYGIEEREAVRAGQELAMPFDSLTAGHLERGREIYNSFCSPCHGTGGQGEGPVSQRGYPPPPSLFLQNATEMPDGRMFHILTYGQKNMPGYAAQISRTDRWKSIAYVRQMQTQHLRQQQAEEEQNQRQTQENQGSTE